MSDASFKLHTIRWVPLLIGAALAMAHHLSGGIPEWIDYSFFALFVVLLGIPHGAVDHLIEEQYYKNQRRTFSLIRFLGMYLLQMGAYSVLWFFFPSFSLLLFLILSAWHFGESDLQPSPAHFSWMIVQFFLGTAILFFILLRQEILTGDLIFRITQENQQSVEWWLLAAKNQHYLFVMLICLLVSTVAYAGQKEKVKYEWRHLAQLSILLTIIYFLPLLPAFALYFGGWHSLNTFQQMSQFLSAQPNNQPALWKKSIPFTLLAIVFLLITGSIWWHAFSNIDPLPILFVFISIITLPHLFVMHKMFLRKDNFSTTKR